MAMELLIKDIPDDLALELLLRARLNHPSLEEEVLVILAESIDTDQISAPGDHEGSN